MPLFPHAPPRFLARTPHGYHEVAAIRRDLKSAGFASAPCIDSVALRSRASDASVVSIAFCQGTPVRNEIETLDASRSIEATEAASAAVAKRFGGGPVDASMQAHVIAVQA